MSSSKFMKGVSSFVLFAFTALTLQPLSAIAQQKPQPKKVEPSKDAKYGDALEDIKESLLSAEAKHKTGKRADDEVVRIRGKKKELDALDADVEAEFLKTEQHLKDKKLPAEILARHQAAVTEFKSKRLEFKQKLKAVEDADDQKNEGKRKAAIGDLTAFMKKHQKSKTHTPTDPNKLPFRSPDSKVRTPKETASDLRAAIFGEARIQLAGPVPQDLTWMTQAVDVRSLIDFVSDDPDQFDYDNYEFLQVAVDPPTAADLAETEDIVLTPAIKAKATELSNNPVKIYNWVRNNIEFIPSYGSIQGADMTLQTKRGNAVDTASLLIGLLRAANIPARYVYGTVQIPSNQMMNWVGGVTKVEAAQSLLGQGGIPNVGLASGGQVKAIKLEHVWVEAYVDYGPSRGAINKKAGSWTPIDASFKQYQYTAPTNIQQFAPSDASQLLASFTQGAIVNSQQGYIQNLNQSAVENFLETYVQNLSANQNSTDSKATLEKLIGRKQIISESRPILLGTLPYKRVITNLRLSSLPATLRANITLRLFGSEIDRGLDSPSMSYAISLPSVGTKRFGVTYEPASPADAQLLQSWKEAGNTTVPGYLVRVIPKVQLDGLTVATGTPAKMGEPVIWTAEVNEPNKGLATVDDYKRTSGDELVLGINAAGIEQTQVEAWFNKFGSQTPSENLHLTALTYWYQHDTYDRILAAQNGTTTYRMPSVGMFSSSLVVRYFFGIPKTVYYIGRSMDIKRVVRSVESATEQASIKFLLNSGMHGSYLEGYVFDQLFDRERGTGRSAVRLLQQSLSLGSVVYSIDSNNAELINSALTVRPAVKTDIQNAVAAGKIAIVPETEIIQGHWSGIGYILFDPATGAGAYLLDGGLNGGDDGGPCAPQPQPSPAGQNVPRLFYSIFFVLGLAAIAALVISNPPSAVILGIGIVGAAQASSPGGTSGGLTPGLNAIWESSFGKLFGQWPSNFPGDGLPPPGDCTRDQLDSLRSEQKSACGKETSCSKGENCAVIEEKINNRMQCMRARLDVMFICFRGGDGNHWGQIQQQLNGLKNCLECKAAAQALGQSCQKP